MALFTDNFNRSNGALGANYVQVASSGSIAIVGNATAQSTATSTIAELLATGVGASTSDQFSVVTLPTAAGASCAVGARLANPSGTLVTGYLYRLTATAHAIQRLNADGSTTTLVTADRTRTAGDRICIVVQGSTITAYLGGVQQLTTTDTTYTSGRPGFRNAGTTGVDYDDYAAGDYATDAAGVNGVPQPAATAPGQVTGVTLGTPTDTTIPVSWTAVSTATSYVVEYRVTGQSAWTALSPVTTTSTTITGLTGSTGYDVRVTAVNSAGSGTPSATSTATSAAPPASAPGQVTGLAVGTVTAFAIPLTWNALSGATAYTVQYRVTGQNSWQTASSTVTGTSYALTGLAAGTSYDAQVFGTNTAGAGTPSSTVSATTTASGTVVETVNQPRATGLPQWRGLIHNLAGDRILPGDEVHRFRADFYGAPGSYTPPDWLSVPDGTATLVADQGGALELATAATTGARATLRMTVPPTTSALKGILIELRHHRFSAASPAVDWRLFAADGTVGGSAIHLNGMPLAALCSQGENNRTRTAQTVAGADGALRRHVGLLVLPSTKEVFLLEGDSVIGWRDAASTWTDGTVQVGVSITAQAATAVRLRLASLEVRLYA